MCWIGRRGPIVLDKDMSVFKIVVLKGTDIHSYYQSFLYQLNKLYTAELDARKVNENIVINRGFHSYSNECSVEELDDGTTMILFFTILGYNCYRVYDTFELLKQPCIIPSGSIVYINERGEVVSNQIILI